VSDSTGVCKESDDEFKSMMARAQNMEEKRREDYSMCNNLFNI
jgi:hypothetical protein